jgi:sugar (pentulose or hexulose) kinase
MYLGLDLGTANVKAVVVKPNGRIASVGSAPVERYYTDDGGIEQNIGQIWNAARSAIRGAAGRVDSSKILAIGVSSQGGALQILDQNDISCGRVISWLDPRGRPFDASLTAERGEDFFTRRIGHGKSGLTIGQILRLQSKSSTALHRGRRVGFVGDLIVGRLCGRRAHDPTSWAIALLYNPWLKRSDPAILSILGLDDGQLPCLLPATTAAGVLGKAAARAVDLPAGIPVSPAVHDQYAASLGAAAVAAGDVNFGAGTAWVLLANTGKLSRAVVEGLACELRRHLDLLTATGIRAEHLIMCGSATAGRNTPQIIADVTRLPVGCLKTPDISALGAAMLARSLIEPDVPLDRIARQWAPPRRMVKPSRQDAAYQDLYQEYLSLLAGHPTGKSVSRRPRSRS